VPSSSKVDMEFSEDVEASRTSSKEDDIARIGHVELTEEDVCFPVHSLPSIPDETLN